MRTTISATVALLLLPLALSAQAPYLVKDLNTTTTPNPSSSAPYNFFGFGSRVFFVATSVTTGAELWSTDGTESGTALVMDIRAGRDSSSPSRFTVLNGKLFFNATDQQHGEELWTTDGTAAGTRLVADILSSFSSSSPGDRAVYHGSMIFSAEDGVHGRELWITDGTPTGTRFFKDLTPGATGSDPRSFVVFNDTIYFGAANALWKSDGTESGTVIVKEGVYPFDIVVAGSRMFFDGHTTAAGAEPWVSDGTEAGTRMIADVNPGTRNSFLYAGAAFGDRMLFVADDGEHGGELWITDGSAGGTRMIRDINPGANGVFGFPPTFTIVGGVAYFSALNPATGQELWRTDGTEAGTRVVRNVVSGKDGGSVFVVVAAEEKVYFTALAGGERTLWVTDGTANGTRPVRTSKPAPVVSISVSGSFFIVSSSALTNVGGSIYFAGANTLNGFEPWKSDGSDGGTSMIMNIARDAAPSSEPRNLVAAGDLLYFDAWDGLGTTYNGADHPRSLWRTDGTSAGTLELTESPTDGYVAAGRSLFFNKDGVLWTTDGTPEGTRSAGLFASRFPKNPAISFVIGDKVFASVASELWATTTAPNAPAVALGATYSFGMKNVAGRAMFVAPAGIAVSDGTPSGTYTAKPGVTPHYSSKPAVMGGHYYFSTDAGSERKLWKSDGTPEGTVVVKTLTPYPDLAIAAGKNLFFVAGQQLWISDGTESGTHVVSQLKLENGFAVAGERAVFPATTTENGMELWVSDGTAEGTRLLRDIYPGAFGSGPSQLTTVDDQVYFSAGDDLHGTELWVTDGTAEGTQLVADIAPGINNGGPQQFVRAGERLYFTAFTPATGIELWALPLESPRMSIADVRADERDAGTSTVRFTVTLTPASSQTVTVDYATSDGTAAAGSDYDAVAGTLTFAPGETSKSIDVPIRGDASPENNEALFVTLRNASGARLARSTAFAIIDDDDQFADVALSLDFATFNFFQLNLNAANNGPRTATNIKLQYTTTPVLTPTCTTCFTIAALEPGASKLVLDTRPAGEQRWFSATATPRQRDPQPSNNTVAWTAATNIAMDALYLTPGAQANVWFTGAGSDTTVTLESSNPAVISVPATALASARQAVSFVARGLSAGTSTIRVLVGTNAVATLKIEVVATGTKPRWPGGLNMYPDNVLVPFDKPVTVRLYKYGSAPLTGELATGVVTISTNGRELARTPLESGNALTTVPVYMSAMGTQPLTISYSGDANFLPITVTYNMQIARGNVTLLASAGRNGSNARVHVSAAGSPVLTPTGTITVSEPGVIAPITATLTAGIADISLANIPPGTHTLVIAYSGDVTYLPGTQSARIVDARVRAIQP